MGFFQGTQERVRKSCSKRAIGVQAIEVYFYISFTKNALVICVYKSINTAAPTGPLIS